MLNRAKVTKQETNKFAVMAVPPHGAGSFSGVKWSFMLPQRCQSSWKQETAQEKQSDWGKTPKHGPFLLKMTILPKQRNRPKEQMPSESEAVNHISVTCN